MSEPVESRDFDAGELRFTLNALGYYCDFLEDHAKKTGRASDAVSAEFGKELYEELEQQWISLMEEGEQDQQRLIRKVKARLGL